MNYILPTLVLLLSSCASYVPQESAVAPERTPEVMVHRSTPSEFRIGVASVTAEDDLGQTAQLGVDSPVGLGVQYVKQSAKNTDLYWFFDTSVAVANGGVQGIDVQARRFALSGGAEYRLKSEDNPGAYIFAQGGIGFSKADLTTAYASVSGTGIGPVLGIGGNYSSPGSDFGVFVLYRPIEPTVEIESTDVSMSSAWIGVSWSR